jgi:hypothetical protein
VRAGNRHATFQAHQFGEHFGAPHDGQPVRARRGQFRVLGFDRGGIDDDLRIAQIFRALPDGHRNTEIAQAFHIGAFGRIRALHLVAEIAHHFGDAAHADAADADEMNGPDGERHAHLVFAAQHRLTCLPPEPNLR